MRVSQFKVILGPSSEFHIGVHGSFIQYPPAQVTYYTADGTYHYLFQDTEGLQFNPFDHLGISETVEYDLPLLKGYIVHSSRMPVYNSVPWIADMDCLLSTLRYGKFFALGSEERIRSATVDTDSLRLRQQVMLAHYLSDQCKGLLFRSRYRRDLALTYIERERLLDDNDLARLQQKTDVLYPTMPALQAVKKDEERISLVYMGRTYTDKGGDIALEVFSALKSRFEDTIETIYIGEVPPNSAARHPGIKTLPLVNREKYLSFLEVGHIFISPTLWESYGMGLIEAACNGMAIVTTCGVGMEHIQELLENGRNAYFVPNEWSAEEKVEGFVKYASMLIEHREKLKEMRENNVRLTKSGKLSLRERDKKILAYYDAMRSDLNKKPATTVRDQIDFLSQKYRLRRARIKECVCQRQVLKRSGGRNVRIRIGS